MGPRMNNSVGKYSGVYIVLILDLQPALLAVSTIVDYALLTGKLDVFGEGVRSFPG